MRLYFWKELYLPYEGCPGSAFALADSEEQAIDLICANYEHKYGSVPPEAVQALRADLESDAPREITEPYGFLEIKEG